MPSDLEPARFGGDQSVFVGLRGGKGCGRIQFNQGIIFEHSFNIEEKADTLPASNAPQATDNTSTVRTTPDVGVGESRSNDGTAIPHAELLRRVPSARGVTSERGAYLLACAL